MAPSLLSSLPPHPYIKERQQQPPPMPKKNPPYFFPVTYQGAGCAEGAGGAQGAGGICRGYI